MFLSVKKQEQSCQLIDFPVIGKKSVHFFLHVGNLCIYGTAQSLFLKREQGFFYKFTVGSAKFFKTVEALITEYPFYTGMVLDMAGKAAVF